MIHYPRNKARQGSKNMEKKKTLWTKDFSLITITTIISAIAGESLVLPISLLVFDETRSTLLSSIIVIVSFLPDVLFSVLAAPLIDRSGKRRIIVSLDAITVVLMVSMGFLINSTGFNYLVYVIFTLLFSTISVFYHIAYDAWFPSLITLGFEQKGYAVSSTVYPVITLVMAPVSAFLYSRIEISYLFFATAALLVISIILESRITDFRSSDQNISGLKEYISELKAGFAYLKKERGLSNIYTYMSVTNGVGFGMKTLQQAYFQTTAGLSVTMFGLLTTAEMIGRAIGGTLQYFIKIPPKKRFTFTKSVYLTYDTMESILLFFPYPVMNVIRFILGSLGVQSATIRNTAVQSYIPAELRGRVNSIMTSILSIGMIVFQGLGGVLGEFLPYRTATIILGGVNLLALVLFIFLPGKVNRKVYDARRTVQE